AVATFTNLTQDHLDFHPSFEHYRSAKQRLFELAERAGGVAVINADDPAVAAIAPQATRRITFGVNNESALLSATDVDYAASGSSFSVKSVRPARFSIKLPGPFNVSNAMAALATAVALDFDVESIADGLLSLEGVPGRMTRVEAGDVGVFVDYAHTPDGLRKVLEAARA